ncbi:unnamed protein product [Lampetra planeri]
MPQTPCQRKVDGFEGVLEPFCLLYARSSEASAGLWSECTLTVPTDYCLLVHVCLGCPSDGSCTAEHNSFVVLTPMAGTDESGEAGDRLRRTAGPGGRWGELGGRVALEVCAHRCSSALFAMPTNRLHVAFVPESIPPVHSFHALHSYVKVRYLAVPSARADAAAGDHYIQEWLEAGCDNGASGKFPPMPPHGIPADGNQAVISERSAMGPAPSLAERIVHLGGGYPVFRLVADDDEDGRHLLGELVHSYLQHWLPSPLRLRLRTRSLRLSYSRQKGHRPPPPPDAPNYAVPRMAYPLESCQFELQGKSGRFYSPNFPDSYPELGWCSWNLQVRETQSIVVKICGFTGGDECCLHSDRLIFEESPRRNIMAMVLSCWGHDTYYYTPKGSGLSVLLVSGDRQALNSAAPRRFWGEYFVLDEWDTLDLSRLNCGESEYTWFEMSVDSMLQKKAREGLSLGRIVRLLSSHLSQLMEKNASDYYGSNFLSVLPRQAGWVAQGLQVQTKFHVFFRHLPRASARQLQRSLRNLPGQHLESADGALRLQLLSIDVTEAPEVAALVSPLAVALGSAACILVLLVLVGVAVSSVAVKGRRRRRRLRLEANGFSCTSTPAIYFHRRWEDWDPPPAPTLSDATLVSQPRVGPPMVSASSISAPDNLASLNGGTSTGGQWRASASADV